MIQTEMVRIRPKYDTSTKEYEVQVKRYSFDGYSRAIRNEPKWSHEKYYSTEQAALDAIKDIRKSLYDVYYRNYPPLGTESKYPHIKPTINIKRYRIVKRSIL